YKKSVSETSNEIYEKLVRFDQEGRTYLRPLYALMLVDALSEKKPISYAKDILEHTYYRIQRTIKDSLADDGFGVSDNGYSNEQKTALILNVIATMIGTVSVDATCTALGITLPIQQASSDKRFSGISIFNNENCEPIEPDIIGTYFVLKCIEDNILENPSQYISYAWRLDENHYMRGFMKRLLQEWETSESAFKHFNLDTFSTVEIRDGETEVATQAFMSHTYIKKIIIPASITHIKFEAFTGCGNLEEVVFAESSQLESIGTAAFYGCVRLITINLPSALTTIGSHAFEKCPLGDSVIVPASINNAGKFAFFGCRVTFPDGFGEAFETRLLGGETLEFGGLIWDVVDERSYKGRIQKLIITHEVIEKRAYDAVTEDFWDSDDYTGTDWHNCSLRAYLNSTVHEYKQPDGTKSKFDFSTNGFLSRFTDEQLRQICPLEENGVPFTANENSSEGYVAANETQVAPVPGKETIDKVFLLSTKEVKKYYQPIEISAANYLKWCHGNGFDVGAPDEEFLTGEFSGWFPAAFPMSEDLIACDGKETAWWWLRSPGDYSDYAACVYYDGYVYVDGNKSFRESGGVRPALWLNL
ncbi:MAG: leucine-rich repeat domain-containing protein, partial [Chitinispirillales bacterium]|nr:leucine-rich repeat domain-containing protein [Chitinispirillales bacterium]